MKMTIFLQIIKYISIL